MNPESQTSPTLLGRLGGDAPDAAAWELFVLRYGRRLLGWCRHWGLQSADAEDVCQDVMVRVNKQMRTFRYEPGKSFRGWLKVVARRAWSDWATANKRPGGGVGCATAGDALDSVAAGDDLLARIDAEYDLELLEIATKRVKVRVAETTWESYRLTAQEGLSGADAAARLGIKVTAVLMNRSRVQKMLQEEVRALELAS